MITGIGGLNFVPGAMINVTPEFFYYGDDIIGGFLTLELKGIHHAQNSGAYSGFLNSALSLIDSCQTIDLSNTCNNGSVIDDIDSAIGVVRDVRVSPAGSALDINYNIIIECSKDSSKSKIIENNSTLDFEGSQPEMIIKSYSESVSADYSDVSYFSIDGTKFSKNNGKLNIQLDIAAYDNDQCDSNNINYQSGLIEFLEGRATNIAGDTTLVKIAQPDGVYANNLKKTLGKTSASISFDLHLLAQDDTKAIVEFTEVADFDQILKRETVKIQGSIVGVDSSKTETPSEDAWANAKSAYDDLKNYFITGINNERLITDCNPNATISQPIVIPNPNPNPNPNPIQSPPQSVVTNPVGAQASDFCYQLVSSRLSEFPSQNKIDFEMTYKDAEKCELYGYTLSTQYEEKPAVSGRAEHFAPGRPANYAPLVYASTGTSAPKYKLTVKGEMPSSCLQLSVGQSNSYLKNEDIFTTGVGSRNMDTPWDDLKSQVSGEFTDQETRWGLTPNSNMMQMSEQKTEGRYSYSITKEYIKCQ